MPRLSKATDSGPIMRLWGDHLSCRELSALPPIALPKLARQARASPYAPLPRHRSPVGDRRFQSLNRPWKGAEILQSFHKNVTTRPEASRRLQSMKHNFSCMRAEMRHCPASKNRGFVPGPQRSSFAAFPLKDSWFSSPGRGPARFVSPGISVTKPRK